jgi:hypothetical protein
MFAAQRCDSEGALPQEKEETLMRVFSLATLAVALICASSAASAGSGALSQAGTQSSTYPQATSPGTILLVRPMSDPDNQNRVTGSALFSIHDDGFRLRQLTPFAEDVFNLPDAWFQPFLTLENWVGNAFSPSGRFSQFLNAHTAQPTSNNPFAFGKYFIMNAWGQRTPPLFPGGNDLERPKDGPSYGFLTWGPAGTDLIAFTNSVNGTPVRHACVRVIHPNGTGKRTLWCAKATYPQYKQAIEGLRWSGDGRSLLAYLELTLPQSPNFPRATKLYRIRVATGRATLVNANVTSPLHGPGGDLSYDGHEVVFQVNAPGACTPDEQEQMVVCARNMRTGRQAALVDLDRVLVLSGGQLLLTPDGSHAVVTGSTRVSNATELYLIKTDGTQLRRLTVPCVPLDPNGNNVVVWHPVRLSPDGQRVLANCYSEQGSPFIRFPTRIYVVNLANGSARYVTDGFAYDWHVPTM